MRVVAWTAGIAWFVICTSLSYARFARRTPIPAVVVQHSAVQPPPDKLEPTAAPTAVPMESAEGENPAWDHSLDAAPERVDLPTPSAAQPAPSAPALPAAPALPSVPARTLPVPVPAPASGLAAPSVVPSPGKHGQSAPSHKPKAHKDSAAKVADATSVGEPAGSATLEPAARCLECGAPAASWVEVDGKRVGYCRKHYSRLDRPRASRKRSRAQPQAPAIPPAAGEPPSAVEAPQVGRQESAEEAPVQCRGITKDGTRCRRKTKDPSGFCYQHRPR